MKVVDANESHLSRKSAPTLVLTAQTLVLQPRRQLGYLNSNLMLRWDGHVDGIF